MNKKLAAGAAGLVLLAGGSAVAVRSAADSGGSCPPPITLFPSEQTASVEVLEAYISENIAPSFKYPEQLLWASDDFNPILLPNRIAARIMLIEGQNLSLARYYHVTMARDCQGGEWRVVEFEKVK